MSTNKIYDRPTFKAQYDNYINGKWIAPTSGKYFDVITPLDGTVMAQAAHTPTRRLAMPVPSKKLIVTQWMPVCRFFR